MANEQQTRGEQVTRWLALAARLEGEGQYNLAKLLRAASESVLRHEVYLRPAPPPGDALLQVLQDVVVAMDGMPVATELRDALARGVAEMAAGRLPLIKDTPHPYVCRTCGTTTLGAPPPMCPTCGAQAATFKRFLPVYWLQALDPPAALAHLRATPDKVAALLAGVPEEEAARTPAEGGWNLRQALAHLRDAQGVLAARVDLLLAEDEPELTSQAVFTWAARAEADPPTTAEIFADYKASRARTVATLEDASWAQWQRRGFHEEFGPVTVTQQASYFATHELTHLPQLEALRTGDSS
jgi:hypothetical protein